MGLIIIILCTLHWEQIPGSSQQQNSTKTINIVVHFKSILFSFEVVFVVIVQDSLQPLLHCQQLFRQKLDLIIIQRNGEVEAFVVTTTIWYRWIWTKKTKRHNGRCGSSEVRTITCARLPRYDPFQQLSLKVRTVMQQCYACVAGNRPPFCEPFNFIRLFGPWPQVSPLCWAKGRSFSRACLHSGQVCDDSKTEVSQISPCLEYS